MVSATLRWTPHLQIANHREQVRECREAQKKRTNDSLDFKLYHCNLINFVQVCSCCRVGRTGPVRLASHSLGGAKGLPPEDPVASHSPDHVPSATQMGQVRIWQICDYQSKSGRKWEHGRIEVAKKLITMCNVQNKVVKVILKYMVSFCTADSIIT